MKRANLSYLVVFAAFLCCANLYGQSANSGGVTGTLRDATGAVIPGVAARITNVDTRDSRETVTDERGTYAFGFLTPGRYRIEFSQSGFKTVVREGITVAVTERVTVDETLEIASQKETVTVTAQGEIIQAATTTLGRVVDSVQLAALPLVTRNFTQLTALSPGVTASLPDSLAVGNGSQDVNTNGTSGQSSSYTLDGADANNTFGSRSFTTLGIVGVAVPSIDSIQEFKVQTSLYDASFGRKTGANITIVTKSGTSEFHGSAYEFFRNDVLNANSFFFNSVGSRRPRLRQNVFGGTLGGPILKDRTFFFVNYEGMRQLNGAGLSSTSTLVLPPIPLDRSASALGAVFGGQAGARGGLAVAADGSNIHPVALKLLSAKLPNGDFLIPSPQRSGPGVNYAISVPANYDQDQFRVNVDHQLSAKNRLTGRYLWSTSLRLEEFVQTNVPGYTSTVPADNQNATLSDVHVFGANTINEVRVGFARFKGESASARPVKDVDVGIFRATQQEFPAMPLINVQGAFSFGQPNTETDVTNNGYSLSDTLSFKFGRHDLRAGTDSRRDQTNLSLTPFLSGIITIQSFPDFLIGRAAGPVASGGNGTTFSSINQTMSGNGDPYRAMRSFEQTLFIADDWKVNSRLTLNLGLRYEFLGNFSDAGGSISSFDPRRYQPPPTGGVTSAGLVQPENARYHLPGVPLVSNTLVDSEDRNNFAPRFGFAYRPWSGRSVVLRGGYGIFFDRSAGQGMTTALGLGSPPFAIRYQLAAAANAASSLDRPFPTPPARSDFPIPFEIASPTLGRAPQLLTFVDPLIRTPYVAQYNLNIQHAITPNLLLEVGYAGTKGTRLLTGIGYNQALLASPSRPVNGITTNSPANAAQRVPFIGFSPTGLTGTQSSGTSNYNSLQTSLTRRFAQGLQFLASYTWSKTLNTEERQDNNNIRADGYGLANFDRTHRFVFSYVYDLPGPTGKQFTARILGGWQTAGVVTMQSGLPFSITDSRGSTLYGVTGARGSFAPGATIETARLDGSVRSRLTRYFNTDAFLLAAATIPAGGQTPDGFPVSAAGTIFGNTGRNILRGPGQKNIDFVLVKRIAVTESIQLEFRSEFFNLFNNVNFGNPGREVSNLANFGLIGGTTSAPRVIQFALKLYF